MPSARTLNRRAEEMEMGQCLPEGAQRDNALVVRALRLLPGKTPVTQYARSKLEERCQSEGRYS